jgi:hypothetical protein
MRTDDLLTLAKVRAFWPDEGAPLDDDALLALLTSEARDTLFPQIVKLRQDYGQAFQEYSLAANQQQYRLPHRAHAQRVAGVSIYDSAGNIVKPPLIRQSDVAREWGAYDETTSDLERFRYFLSGNRVNLYPRPSSAFATMRLTYNLTPATYVLAADCRQIATYNGATIITAGSNFPAWTSVDIYANGGAGEHLLLAGAGAAVTTTLTLSTIPPLIHGVNDIAVGDWVCSAGESCVISFPDVACSVLCDLLVARMHESQGDQQGYASAVGRVKDGMQQVEELLGDRTDDEAETYVPHGSALWSDC